MKNTIFLRAVFCCFFALCILAGKEVQGTPYYVTFESDGGIFPAGFDNFASDADNRTEPPTASVSFSFNSDDATVSFNNTGKNFPDYTQVAKLGYVAVGWKYKTSTTYFSSNTGFLSTQVLVPAWLPLVRFSANGGEFPSGLPDTLVKVTYDAISNAPIIGSHWGVPESMPNPANRPGYRFKGWNKKANGTGIAFTADSVVPDSMTVYAKWDTVKYRVVFSSNGGEFSNPTAVSKTLTIDSTSITLWQAPMPPTREGYRFAGWVSTEGGVEWLNPNDLTTVKITGDTITGDSVYCAHYNASWIKTYKVTFISNGGTPVDTTIIVDDGHAVSEPTPPPTREGYNFGLWRVNADTANAAQAVFPATITHDTTFYARWRVKPYTVTFKMNDGTATTFTDTVVCYNTQAKTPQVPLREGYTFIAWRINADTSSAAFNFDGSVMHDTTLYAHWRIESYLVTFKMNDGTTATFTDTVVYYNAHVLEPVVAPTRYSYVFMGWFADADTTTAFDFSSKITSSTIIYAKWRYDYTLRFTSITITVDGGAKSLELSRLSDTMIVSNAAESAYVAAAALNATSVTDTGAHSLREGKNIIVVTAENSNSDTSYTIVVYRKVAADSIPLLDIVYTDRNGNTLDESVFQHEYFNPSRLNYKAVAKCGVDTVYLSTTDVNGDLKHKVTFLDLRPGHNIIERVFKHPITGLGVAYTFVVHKDFDSTLMVKKFGTLTVNNNRELNGGYNFNGYTWYYDVGDGNGLQEISEAKGQCLIPGSYLNIPAGAKFTVNVVTVEGLAYGTCPLSAPEVLQRAATQEFEVFPNPVSANATLQVQTNLSPLEQSSVTVNMYNATGRFIRSEKLTNGTATTPSESGMYLIQLQKGSISYGSKWILVK